MAYCSKCGNELRASTQFCDRCGDKISNPAVNAAPDGPSSNSQYHRPIGRSITIPMLFFILGLVIEIVAVLTFLYIEPFARDTNVILIGILGMLVMITLGVALRRKPRHTC